MVRVRVRVRVGVRVRVRVTNSCIMEPKAASSARGSVPPVVSYLVRRRGGPQGAGAGGRVRG